MHRSHRRTGGLAAALYAAIPERGLSPQRVERLGAGRDAKNGQRASRSWQTTPIWVSARRAFGTWPDRPPIWEIAGATVPGVPFHLLGHNGRVAWGMTTTHADTQDLVIETVDPADPGPVPDRNRSRCRSTRHVGDDPGQGRGETRDPRAGDPQRPGHFRCDLCAPAPEGTVLALASTNFDDAGPERRRPARHEPRRSTAPRSSGRPDAGRPGAERAVRGHQGQHRPDRAGPPARAPPGDGTLPVDGTRRPGLAGPGARPTPRRLRSIRRRAAGQRQQPPGRRRTTPTSITRRWPAGFRARASSPPSAERRSRHRRQPRLQMDVRSSAAEALLPTC